MIDLTNENTTYKDISQHLKDNFTKGFDIFDSAQVSLQLASMVNYKPILFPLIESVVKQGVAEIGGYKGNHLKELNVLSKRKGVTLHSVNPANKILPEDHLSYFSEVEFFDQKSSDYFCTKKSQECDIFIIDGDHNFETVSLELENVLTRDNVQLVVLHDTSWPCGYIDTFYDKESMVKRKVANAGYMNLQKDSSDLSLPFNFDIDFDEVAESKNDGLESNSGVTTAIEKSLSKCSDWGTIKISSIYGLTILYRDSLRSNTDFISKIEHIEYVKPFLDILELNRIMLLSQMYKQGLTWNADQCEIERLKRIIEQKNQIKNSEK